MSDSVIFDRREEDKMMELIIQNKINEHAKNCEIWELKNNVIRQDEHFKLLLHRIETMTKRLDYTNWLLGGMFIIITADVILYLLKIR